ncbi:hypothetical protein PC113_g15247 [Phytophthora cactorum]|uniref:Uncharacterized protein n=2 Tax=Phytophthora cactorum TaxID=29920 RepID=A0A8T0YPT8_9STRA|nr:hypothetical protein PC113_g15247 [Phytophthora cactorum]KAG3054102.1 hypothetical protein PC121_g16457 [Phytophthora cactorum]
MSANAGHIYLFDGPNLNGYYMDWSFSETQRCYSMPCFNDRAHSLKFRELPEGGHLVLYEESACQGKHYKIAASRGKVKYKDGAFEFGISSFMIWSSGIYATNGMVNICEDHDRRRLNPNSTNIPVAWQLNDLVLLNKDNSSLLHLGAALSASPNPLIKGAAGNTIHGPGSVEKLAERITVCQLLLSAGNDPVFVREGGSVEKILKATKDIGSHCEVVDSLTGFMDG